VLAGPRQGPCGVVVVGTGRVGIAAAQLDDGAPAVDRQAQAAEAPPEAA
jgi:hypothetical protein